MIKYSGHYIAFQEVPNETSLVLTITNCPYRCKGCHSPWLQEDTGSRLTTDVLFRLMAEYKDAITCVCFMGDGGDAAQLGFFIDFIHMCGYKVCVYTGNSDMDLFDWKQWRLPDYYKVGPYVEELGGLDSPTTNQRMYQMNNRGNYVDITHLFWKEKK